MRRLKDIQSLRIYVRVARLGSFSAAARECGLVQSQVSRMIADLEADLGTRLLARTTRAVVPTEAGLEFLARVEPILAALDDPENSVRDACELRGLLRIGMPSTMAVRVIMPRLARFSTLHPKLQLQLLLDDAWQDMVREAVDVGIRVGNLPEASGTVWLIGTMERVVVAAPRYLAAQGTPAVPDDLHGHRIVIGPAGAQPSSWTFTRDGVTSALELNAHVTINDTTGAVAAAVNGLGITSTTSWGCRAELQAGTLVHLFPEWHIATLPIHAFFPQGRATRIAARTFVDYLTEDFMQNPEPA